ncbi:BTB/POZ domain-containing protein 2 [Sagmatias obliquidens]|uniref:BTB/POZ domain-containing protein 2 n=1 Tax=Sagmatias obliquidens TaxID=3371155 RepID=UPI000F43F962|nr:BTB/POZ domain-containing protein 2 [Lagenorhynchus obliquidens]
MVPRQYLKYLYSSITENLAVQRSPRSGAVCVWGPFSFIDLCVLSPVTRFLMTVALWWVLRTAWLFFPVLLLVKTFFSSSHTLNSSRINHPSVCPSLHPTVIETVLTEDISFPVGLTFRFVLAVGSAVFDAMFNGGMATTSTEIELPDVEPAAFLALLKFLYSDEVQIGPETVMTTLYTAKKYAVPALEAHCVEFLKKNLRADNAFMLLTQARLFDEPQLASLCLENIDKNTADAITAEGFTDIDLDTLVAVLERDTLGIREVRLFNAVVRWSEAECQRQQLQVMPENKRKVLGKALALIRFPLMTIEEFAAGPAQSGILVDREVVSLFLHFTVNPKPRVDFIDRPRCCLRGKECSVNRFQQVESRWGYSGTSDRIRFSVNKRIFVVGFGLYGSIHGPTDYQVNIQIIHTDSNTVLGQNDTGFSCDGSASTFRVMFKEPVEVLPNVNYTACATLKGPDSHYGTKGLRKVTHESPTTGAKTCFTFCYAAGNNNGTSVEDGQIPEVIFYT